MSRDLPGAGLCVQNAWALAPGRCRQLLLQPRSHPGHLPQILVSTASFGPWVAQVRPLLLGSGLPGLGLRDAGAFPSLSLSALSLLPSLFPHWAQPFADITLSLPLSVSPSPRLPISTCLFPSVSLSVSAPLLSRKTSHRWRVEKRGGGGEFIRGERLGWVADVHGETLVLAAP